MSKPLLQVHNVTMQFGGLKAVDQLHFEINQGQLAGLIGPNGAGKTTVFNILTGVYQPTQGSIKLDGTELTGLKPYKICEHGLTRTFQNIRLFKGLTVLENVLIAGHKSMPYSFWDLLIQNKKYFHYENEFYEKALDLLNLFGLKNKAHHAADSLPYGEQRKLEIVRALATQPKMILLDEPAAGMNHSETHGLMEMISHIRKQFDLTVLLIEHDMKLVMGICEKIIVLDHGIKIEEGLPAHVQKSKKVIEAYLGVEELT